MMSNDEILDKLSQEERLELLERLIKGAAQAKEENLTLDQRVERLEKMAGFGHKPIIRVVGQGECGCCG
ncbi:MAG: hypothetical protein GY803_23150 [Chloroflexi bacterium]|nr:hypothetical protein [Chloroflexota bacterium]